MNTEQDYWPLIEGGRVVQQFEFADYRAVLLTEPISRGRFDYLYVLLVFKLSTSKLCLCVASERLNDYGRKALPDIPLPLGESYTLGVYPGKGHRNLGSSNDWSDIEKFTTRAFKIVRSELRVSVKIVDDIQDDLV